MMWGGGKRANAERRKDWVCLRNRKEAPVAGGSEWQGEQNEEAGEVVRVQTTHNPVDSEKLELSSKSGW